MFSIITILFIIIITIGCVQFLQKKNKKLSNEYNKLSESINEFKALQQLEKDSYEQLLQDKKNLENELIIDEKKHSFFISEIERNQQQLKNSKEAFLNYAEILDTSYNQEEEQQDKKILELQNQKNLIVLDIDSAKNNLSDIKELIRKAQEVLREMNKEDKVDMSEYQLNLSENDKSDINNLQKVRDYLHNPRILDMLIWTTFYQKPMTALCKNIFGTQAKCGIYKITNQLTQECYIGQSLDIQTRLKTHAKCGLGIDTPQKNKLYQAMLKDGLYNFSWELVTECPQQELDEKERYYIDLYDSQNYGYNSTKGNK